MSTQEIIYLIILLVAVLSPIITIIIFEITRFLEKHSRDGDKILKKLCIPVDIDEQKIWFELLDKKLFCDIEEGDIFIPTNTFEGNSNLIKHLYIKYKDRFINIFSSEYSMKNNIDETEIFRVLYVPEDVKKKILKLLKK